MLSAIASLPARLASLVPRRDPLLALFEQYERFATDRIARGKAGELRLAPKAIWLKISENCNLRCVGCFTDSFKKEYTSVDEVRKAIEFATEIQEISFTTNEALLSPHFCDIIDLCRERHPKAKLWIITNGTIPIKGRYRAAIAKLDKVGLSIDGCTKETYEGIRRGARFEDFLANTRDIVQIRAETGMPKEITFGFTATATNLHELGGVIRLAKEVGVTDVWAQAMQITNSIVEERIASMVLDRMDPVVRTNLIDQAREEGTRLGMPFYFSDGLYPVAKATAKAPVDPAAKQLHVRMCQYPYEQPAQISREGDQYVVRPCCYISTIKGKVLVEKYGLAHAEMPTGEEVYNSPGMWRFREALLQGDTREVCGSCDAARGHAWKPPA